MNQARIYLSPPHLEPTAQQYMAEAIASNWIAPVGPFITRFEKALCDYSQSPHCIAVNSGTSAIHLALIVAGVTDGDEVLCSTFTFAASAFPIRYQRATPIFVECEAQGWNICPDTLEQAITARHKLGKHPKALIVAHCYGNPADMPRILNICEKHNITVIEDAAEAVGSSLQGIPMGNWASLGAYSFNGNKIITCSSGGALLCKNDAQAKLARKIAAQAKEPVPHFEHHLEGHNFLMSNLLAAVGVSQLEVLADRVKSRRERFDSYQEQLHKIPGCSWQHEIPGAISNRWLSTFYFSSDSTINTSDWISKLAAENIESRALWKPLHTQVAFKDCPYYGDGLSERLYANGICLPSGQKVNEDSVQQIFDHHV